MMRALSIRAMNWLSRRRDDRGVVSSEYLMWTAVAAGIIGLLIVPRMESILGGVLDAIEEALPG